MLRDEATSSITKIKNRLPPNVEHIPNVYNIYEIGIERLASTKKDEFFRPNRGILYVYKYIQIRMHNTIRGGWSI